MQHKVTQGYTWWVNRIAAVVLALLFLTWGANELVEHEVKAGASARLNAAELDTLRNILNTLGVAVWPNFAADPATCNSNAQGAYYFNTSSSTFRVCDGVGWADGGGGVGALNDLSDVTIASPATNEVLRFNGTNWANAASSASNFGDLGDVTLTAPASGDIPQFNGSIWVNVAGASPTTLAGQSDVTIASPAEGDYLIRNGTDWKNVNPSGSFVLFPFPFVLAGHAQIDDFIVSSANDVRVYRHSFPYACTVDRIVWANATVSGCAGAQGAVALFALDGNTKVIDSGAQVYDTLDEIHNIDITNAYIEQGSYWVAYTQASISGNCDVIAFADPTPTSSPGVDTILNTGSTMIGTAANQSVSGAMPTTLGVITANNTNVNRPLIKFVCTDP